jgi:hypothetical protein
MPQAAALLTLSVLLVSSTAGAAPLIVEAGVVIEAEARDTRSALQVEGAVTDDRGGTLAGRSVTLRIVGRRDRLLAEVEAVTDASGHFSKEFAHIHGVRALVVTTDRDALYAAGRFRTTFVRTEPPKPSSLSARAEVAPGALDDSVRIMGQLTVGGLGRAATLSLTPGGSLTSEATGYFEVELGGWRFPSRRAEVLISYGGGSDATRAAASVSVLLPEAVPTPASAYLGPLAATLLLLIGAWLRAWWRMPRPTKARRLRPVAAPVLEADIAPATPYALADQDGVAGVLVDRTDGEPLAGGRISLLPGNRVALTDQHGRFRFDQVPPGTYTLLGEAPDHMPGQAPARFPHRGELAAVRLALTPVREAVLEVWRQAAVERRGSDPWPLQTPEEVAKGVMGDFARLTSLLEETWWSARPADPNRLVEAEALTAHRPVDPAGAP